MNFSFLKKIYGKHFCWFDILFLEYLLNLLFVLTSFISFIKLTQSALRIPSLKECYIFQFHFNGAI